MLMKCIARCWDSQSTMRYWPGAIADLPEDHPLTLGKNPCFIKVTPEEISKGKETTDTQLRKLMEMIAEQGKKIEELEGKKAPEGMMKSPEPIKEEAEERRGPGRPPRPKE